MGSTELPEVMAIAERDAAIDKKRAWLKLKIGTISIVSIKASLRLISIPARASPLGIDPG
jgi:hypothetical protein